MRGLLLLSLFLALPAHAAEVPPALRNWLQALDSAPTAAQLQHAGGTQTAALLEQVARAPKEVSFVRSRAIGLLSLLDDPASEARLQQLLHISDVGLRATAALAWLAGPARRHPETVDKTVAMLLSDVAPAVRSATARGLMYLPNVSTARELATRRRAQETDPQTRAALDAAIRKMDEKQPRR